MPIFANLFQSGGETVAGVHSYEHDLPQTTTSMPVREFMEAMQTDGYPVGTKKEPTALNGLVIETAGQKEIAEAFHPVDRLLR